MGNCGTSPIMGNPGFVSPTALSGSINGFIREFWDIKWIYKWLHKSLGILSY